MTGTSSPRPVLSTITLQMLKRFRRQISLVDLQSEGAPGVVREAVGS